MSDDPRERCVAFLTCPVCHAGLSAVPGALRCANGHAYDIAREGYVNLLPSGHGRSRRGGDDDGMIRARTRFLERGHYDALANALVACATAAFAGVHGPPAFLEAGCGTGDYLARLGDACGGDARLLGFDVSRDAVRLSARRHPQAFFFVNDVTQRLAVADGAIDLLLDSFAPRNPAEFARVLRPGGELIVVLPTDDHLRELRARLPLLDVPPDKEARVEEAMAGAFERVQRTIVRDERTLPPADVADLLRMTPSAWHLPEDAFREAEEMGELRVSFGFVLLRFRKTIPAD